MKDNKVYLQDILQAIDKIDKYLKDFDFDQFKQNHLHQDAVIRQLEIIGEAANRLGQEFLQQYPSFPIKEAIQMRNFLIHGYDEVNLKTVWKTIETDLSL